MKMIEKVTLAIKQNMIDQLDAKPLGEDKENWLAKGGTLDVGLVVKAAIEAMREPDPEMVVEGISVVDNTDLLQDNVIRVYYAMINKALEE